MNRVTSNSSAVLPSLMAIALGALTGAAFAQSPVGTAHLLYLPDNSTAVDHTAIIQTFESHGFVVSTFAYAGENRITYARRIAGEVRNLIRQGVDPSSISVMGGGSGSDIALLTSAATGNQYVNFVVLGSCDRALKEDHHIRLAGKVLALRDAGDDASQSCRPLFTGSPRLQARKDLVLDTSYGATLFNAAHNEWTKPAMEWMSSGKVDVGEVKVAQADR